MLVLGTEVDQQGLFGGLAHLPSRQERASDWETQWRKATRGGGEFGDSSRETLLQMVVLGRAGRVQRALSAPVRWAACRLQKEQRFVRRTPFILGGGNVGMVPSLCELSGLTVVCFRNQTRPAALG